MIEFVFVCPHCGTDDYNDIEIVDTNYTESFTCKYCKQIYAVRIDVMTNKPQKVKDMGTDITLR